MLLALFLAALPSFQDPVELTIQSDEGEPVSGLTVRVTSPQGKARDITDVDGKVSLTPIDGAGFLRVNEKGYTPIAIPWSNELHGATITIHRRATLEGYVTLEDGTPIDVEATVGVRWMEDIGPTQREVEQTTLAIPGQPFLLEDLPHGKVTLFGQLDGLATPLHSKVVKLDSGPNRVDYQYSGPSTGSTLRLAVRAPQFGVALSSTKIEVRSADGTSKKIGVPVTHTIGNLLVTGLGPPPYEIESLDPRLTAGVVKVAKPGRLVGVKLRPTESLDFVLLDEDGAPVPEAKIIWVFDRFTVDLHHGAIEGPVKLDEILLADGAYLMIERMGRDAQRFPLHLIEGEVRLARKGDLTIQVLDEGGSPVQGATCTIATAGTVFHPRNAHLTDGHGRVRLGDMPPGELFVRVEFEGGVIAQDRVHIDGDTRVYLSKPQLGYVAFETVKIERRLANRFPTNASIKFTSKYTGQSFTTLLSPGNRLKRQLDLVAGVYDAVLHVGKRNQRRSYPLGEVTVQGNQSTDFKLDWADYYPLEVDFQVTFGGEIAHPILVKAGSWVQSTQRAIYLPPGTHELTLSAKDGSWSHDVTLTTEPGTDRIFELNLD